MNERENWKRVAVLTLVFCVICVFLPETVWATQQQFDENTPAQEVCYYALEQAYRYLNDFYIDQHPEAALESMFGSATDNTELQNLADAIAQGCETDREKADAVYDWVVRNVGYTADSNAFPSPLPIDAALSRVGNCASNGYLMMDLLRKMGIPAVFGAGWCLPMTDMTIGEVTYKNEAGFYRYAGHAWCFVYIDGEWLLYDASSPYFTKGVHDIEELSTEYYVASIAHVTPAYDYPYVLPGHKWVIYDGKKHFGLDQNGAVGDGAGVSEWYNLYMTNDANGYWSLGTEYDYWHRMWDGDLSPVMEPGEIYAGKHWFYQVHNTYGRDTIADFMYYYFYGEANGFKSQATIRYMGDVPYFLNGSFATNISCLEVEPRVRYGCLAIPIGYEGPVLVPSAEGLFAEGGLTYHWRSEDTNVATIDGFEGNLIAWEEGFTTIYLSAIRNHDSGSAGGDSLEIYVYDPDETVSYADQVDHEHTYERIQRDANCEIGGVVMDTCSHPDCADSIILSSTPALGHAFTSYTSNNNATKTLSGTKTAQCDRQGCAMVDTLIEYDSALGQVILDKTTDRGVYQVPSTQVDEILGDESHGALWIEAPSYHGVEIKISDLRKAAAEEKDPHVVLHDKINVSLVYLGRSGLLDVWEVDSVVIRAGECGKDSLSAQQLQTVEASDAAMLLSVMITDEAGQQLDLNATDWNCELGLSLPFFLNDGTQMEYQVYYLETDGTAVTVNSYHSGDGAQNYLGTYAKKGGIYLIAKNVPENVVKEQPKDIELEPELLVIIAVAAAVVVVLIVLVAKKKKVKKKEK